MSDNITLNLNESNDIRFDVQITSTERLSGEDAIKLRFVCESNDIEYSFRGESINDGSVRVIIPSMKGMLKEGTYPSRLEVIVEGHYFVPLEFDTEFKIPLKVVAEGVRVVSGKSTHIMNELNVSAAVKKPEQKEKTLIKHIKSIPQEKTRDVLKEMNDLIKDLE